MYFSTACLIFTIYFFLLINEAAVLCFLFCIIHLIYGLLISWCLKISRSYTIQNQLATKFNTFSIKPRFNLYFTSLIGSSWERWLLIVLVRLHTARIRWIRCWHTGISFVIGGERRVRPLAVTLESEECRASLENRNESIQKENFNLKSLLPMWKLKRTRTQWQLAHYWHRNHFPVSPICPIGSPSTKSPQSTGKPRKLPKYKEKWDSRRV